MATPSLRTGLIGLALVLLMLVTRFHHFGSALQLPDASLAVFFAAGFYLRNALSFVVFSLLAAAIDYFAISQMGVSDYCVSSAYPFLLPAYFSLWFAGRWLAQQTPNPLSLLLSSWLAISVAFLFSNGSFYLLSGKYPNPELGQYLSRSAGYYPPYLSYGLMYIGLIALVHLAYHSKLLQLLRKRS